MQKTDFFGCKGGMQQIQAEAQKKTPVKDRGGGNFFWMRADYCEEEEVRDYRMIQWERVRAEAIRQPHHRMLSVFLLFLSV